MKIVQLRTTFVGSGFQIIYIVIILMDQKTLFLGNYSMVTTEIIPLHFRPFILQKTECNQTKIVDWIVWSIKSFQ